MVVSCEKLLSSSDRKIVSSSKTEKVVVVSEAVGDVSGSMETCLAGEYDDTGSPGCVVS